MKFSNHFFTFILPELPNNFFLSFGCPNTFFPFSPLVVSPCYPSLQVYKPLYDFSLRLSPSASFTTVFSVFAIVSLPVLCLLSLLNLLPTSPPDLCLSYFASSLLFTSLFHLKKKSNFLSSLFLCILQKFCYCIILPNNWVT